MTKQMAGILLIVSGVVGGGCQMSKQDCQTKYTLIPKDKQECLNAFPELAPKPVKQPTPGPIIIVKKVSTDLQWQTDDGSGPKIMPAATTFAWDTQLLRDDFFGNISTFTVHDKTSGNPYADATLVVFQTKVNNDTYTIEIWRGPSAEIKWFVTKNGQRKQLNKDSTADAKNFVPKEFAATLVTNPTWTWREQLFGIEVGDIYPLQTMH